MGYVGTPQNAGDSEGVLNAVENMVGNAMTGIEEALKDASGDPVQLLKVANDISLHSNSAAMGMKGLTEALNLSKQATRLPT